MRGLPVAKVFMSGHSRCGEPTGFRVSIERLIKIHTIRGNRNGLYKGGDEVQLFQWSGAGYRSPWERFKVVRIGLQPINLLRDADFAHVLHEFKSGPRFIRVPVVDIAGNDGLSVFDFVDWFGLRSNGVRGFGGDIVHFTDFRY